MIRKTQTNFLQEATMMDEKEKQEKGDKAQMEAAIARQNKRWEEFIEQRDAAASLVREASRHFSSATYVVDDDVQNAVRLFGKDAREIQNAMRACRRGPCGPEAPRAPQEPLKWSRATWGRLVRTGQKSPHGDRKTK